MDMNIKLIVREPSTMSEAVKFMIGEYNDTVLVGMPDTYILNSTKNIYSELLKNSNNADLVLGIWDCPDSLKGRVGQIATLGNKVIASKDKTDNCDYEYLWGTLLFRKNMIRYIDPNRNHPGEQIQEWVTSRFDVQAVKNDGEYMDIGTLKGLKDLYRRMEN
jgi:hypothetical protein